MSNIAPLMTRDVVSALPNDTVRSAIGLMSEKGVGAVLLMTDGVLDGIFTSHDLLNRVLAPRRDPDVTVLKDVATLKPVTIGEDASVRQCAYLIRENHFHHVPVIGSEGRVAGVISTTDFLADLARGFERVIQRVCESSEADECADYYQYVVGDFVD